MLEVICASNIMEGPTLTAKLKLRVLSWLCDGRDPEAVAAQRFSFLGARANFLNLHKIETLPKQSSRVDQLLV